MKISIYIPVYNGSKFIKRCIDSILSQSFKDFELIIVDDGSMDNTVELIKEYKDERIKLYSLTHQGIVEASNFALSKCTGKYIARIDSDDIMTENRLQLQYEFLENNPEYGACCGAAKIHVGDKILSHIIKHFEITEKMLLMQYPIVHSTFMCRTEYYRNYNKEYEFGEDLKLYFDLIQDGIKIGNLTNVLAECFDHQDRICHTQSKMNQDLYKKIRFEYFKSKSIPFKSLLK